MNLTKSLKRFSQISIAAILIFSTSGCVDITLTGFDKAVDLLGNESANWRQVVKDLEKSTKETISYELENFAQTTINTAGAEMRCNATFFDNYVRHEVRKEILRKRNELARKIGSPPRTLPAPLSVVCNAVPGNIELEGKRPKSTSIEFYGYYLNPNDIQMIVHFNGSKARQANLKNPDSPRVIKPKFLAGGQFKVSLNLGDNGISGNILQIIDRISLKSQNQEIYSVHVIHNRATLSQPINVRDQSNMRGGRSTGKATLYPTGKLVIEGSATAEEKLHGVRARVTVVGVDNSGNTLFSKYLDIPTACGEWDTCSSIRSGRSDQDISPEIAQRVSRLNLHFSER